VALSVDSWTVTDEWEASWFSILGEIAYDEGLCLVTDTEEHTILVTDDCG
jgi:hypothetical protein